MSRHPSRPAARRPGRPSLWWVGAGAVTALLLVPAAGNVGARESARDGREEVLAASGRSIGVKQVLRVPVDDVFRVVTDYERYADMIPDVFSAEVLRREGDVVDVRFKYHLVLAGDLGITRRFVHHGRTRIDFSTLGGDLGDLTGAWSFQPGADPGTTEVAYHATLDPRFEAPGFVVKYLLKSEAPRLLDRIQRIAK